jgi:hypothetical protein
MLLTYQPGGRDPRRRAYKPKQQQEFPIEDPKEEAALQKGMFAALREQYWATWRAQRFLGDTDLIEAGPAEHKTKALDKFFALEEERRVKEVFVGIAQVDGLADVSLEEVPSEEEHTWRLKKQFLDRPELAERGRVLITFEKLPRSIFSPSKSDTYRVTLALLPALQMDELHLRSPCGNGFLGSIRVEEVDRSTRRGW